MPRIVGKRERERRRRREMEEEGAVVVVRKKKKMTMVSALMSNLWVGVAALAMPLMLSLVHGAMMSVSSQSKHVQMLVAIIGAVVLLVASPRVVTAAAAQTQTQQPGDTRKKACALTGGEIVPSGWGGKDTGGNSCNSCACDDGNVRSLSQKQKRFVRSYFFPALSLCLCECVCCVGQLRYALADELTPSCLYAYDATSSYACTCVCLCVYEIPIPIARVHQDSMSRPGTRRHVHLPTHVRSSMRTQWKNLWQ